MLIVETVFDPDTITKTGLEYANGVAKTLNGTGYMRNYLCPISKRFCSQTFSEEDTVVDIGCGFGAVLRNLILNGAKKIVGVDLSPEHLEIAKALVMPSTTCRALVEVSFVHDSLPHLPTLEEDTFQSVLCAQVLHYLRPQQFEEALNRLHRILKVGGILYVTVGSPYIESYKGFAEVYQKRATQKDRFPGYMDDVRKFHPNGANHNPGFFLFFDPEDLANRIAEAGFQVLESYFIGGIHKQREQTGLVAIKSSA